MEWRPASIKIVEPPPKGARAPRDSANHETTAGGGLCKIAHRLKFGSSALPTNSPGPEPIASLDALERARPRHATLVPAKRTLDLEEAPMGDPCADPIRFFDIIRSRLTDL